MFKLMNSVFKNYITFFIYGILSVLLYLTEIGIYCRVSSNPIIFFVSVIFIAINSLLIALFIKKKRLFGGGDSFIVTMIGLVYFFGVLIIAIFGPTFIDRSVSYHMAFLVTDRGEIDIREMEEKFSNSIYEKRINDAIKTGFIIEIENGKYAPTEKSKLMTFIFKPLGELTKSLDTYNNLVGDIEK